MAVKNLSQVWEQHTVCEFVTRDTEATLATMVDDAYVNHVPVLTGDPITQALMRSDGLDADQVRLVAIAAGGKAVGERRLQENGQDSERGFRTGHAAENPFLRGQQPGFSS